MAWSVGRSVRRLVCRSVRRSLGRYVGRSVGWSVCGSVSWSAGQSVVPRSVDRSVHRYVDEFVGCSEGQAVGRSVGRSVQRTVVSTIWIGTSLSFIRLNQNLALAREHCKVDQALSRIRNPTTFTQKRHKLGRESKTPLSLHSRVETGMVFTGRVVLVCVIIRGRHHPKHVGASRYNQVLESSLK